MKKNQSNKGIEMESLSKITTRNYFCDQWELSQTRSPETKVKVSKLIKRFKKFEDFLFFLELPVHDLIWFASDDGVFIHIEFANKNYPYFRDQKELISAYLKSYIPMKNYDDVLSDYSEKLINLHLEYEFDLDDYEFEYPSHDYFYMSLFN